MQYVGQTKRKLKERFREHFNKIKPELSHDSIARLNCALPITKTISVIQ